MVRRNFFEEFIRLVLQIVAAVVWTFCLMAILLS
jgi:hypothetical protein